MKKYGRRPLLTGVISFLAIAAIGLSSRLRGASDGYFLVNHQYYSGQCDLIDRSGKKLVSLLGNFCFLFDDGSYIAAVEALKNGGGGLYRFGPDGNLAWHKYAKLSHDAFLDRRKSEFFLIAHQKAKNERRKDLTDERVLGFDLDGREVFSWSSASHLDELESISRKLRGEGLELWPEENDLRDGIFKYTHLNTVLALPPNKIGEKDSRFREGNILLNCWHTGLAFIVDQATKQIVWSHHFPRPVHGIRMDKEGILYFFANRTSDPKLPVKQSMVDAMDPLTGNRRHVFPRPDSGVTMYSGAMGSLEISGNGNMVVTSSLEGKAYEIDQSGKILWSWSNPELDSIGKPKLIYRLSPVSAEQAEKVFNVWKTL